MDGTTIFAIIITVIPLFALGIWLGRRTRPKSSKLAKSIRWKPR